MSTVTLNLKYDKKSVEIAKRLIRDSDDPEVVRVAQSLIDIVAALGNPKVERIRR